MRKTTIHFAVLLLLQAVCGYCTENKIALTYCNVSCGTYAVLNNYDNTGGGLLARKDSYFNTAKTDLYANVYGWVVSLSVPVQLTLVYNDLLPSESMWALRLADISLSFGKRFGSFSGQIMADIPTGYPDTGAWIGSGNFRAGAGVNYDIAKFSRDRLKFGAGAVVKVILTDTAGRGRFGIGSTSGYAIVKGSFQPIAQFKTGIDLYCSYSYTRYSDWASKPEYSTTLIPFLSLSYIPFRRFEFSGRMGYGPTWGHTQQKIATSPTLVGGISAGICL